MAVINISPMIDLDVLERIAPIIRHAAHPLRLQILDYLQHAGEERSVTEIREATGVTQAVVSQQLRILKDQGILSCRRDGSYMLYDIAQPSVLLLLECIRKHSCCDPD